MKQGIKNIIYWIKSIYNDRQWDYDFILNLESKKIDYMIQWWSNDKNTHIEDSKRVLKELKFYKHLIELLDDSGLQYLEFIGKSKFEDIGNGKKQLVETPDAKFNHYVNMKNYQRFLPNIKRYCWDDAILKQVIYAEKLWHLYNRYRELKMRNWWD